MSMRETVARKVEAITTKHQALKRMRFGFLVRPVTLCLGWLIVIFGLITIPFPGPGWLTVFLGIGVLRLELHWAERLLKWALVRYEKISAWYRHQSRFAKVSMIGATWAVVWVVVGGTVYASWQMGAIPALDGVMLAVFDANPPRQ